MILEMVVEVRGNGYGIKGEDEMRGKGHRMIGAVEECNEGFMDEAKVRDYRKKRDVTETSG